MAPHVAVIRFPGSNCEQDCVEAIRDLGGSADVVFHDRASLGSADAVVLPGGFAHGDYLRPGAIAQFSPIMAAVREFARAGGPVLGICNGFQILTEAGLLPGALQKNRGLKFVCGPARLRIESRRGCLTNSVGLGDEISIPVNHFEGNYVCEPDTLRELVDGDRVVMRYVENPNGSLDDIAGIASKDGNVVGLMPHPERATHPLLGSTDGSPLLRGFLAAAGADVSVNG